MGRIVRIGICHDIQERAFTPCCCSAIASRPIVTCSTVATTTSYSRASCSGAISLTHFTSWLVAPDMADVHDRDLVAAIDLGLDLARGIPDAVDIADARYRRICRTMRAMDLLESGV